MPDIVRPPVEALWLSTVDQGRRLELNARYDGLSNPLATILADDTDESLWLEIYVDGKAVQVPLRVVQDAIAGAQEGVHSEAWYGRREAEDGETPSGGGQPG